MSPSFKKIEIIILDDKHQKIIVFGNGGNLTFIEHSNSSTADRPYFLASADVNKDGSVNIIIAYDSEDSVGIHLNDGHGSQEALYPAECESHYVTLANVNDDSSLDIILLTNVSTERSPGSVAVIDVNNDKKLDLVVAHAGANNIGIYLNDENNGFTKQTTYPSDEGRNSVSVGDVDGDKKLDIVTANIGSLNVGIFLGVGDGNFASKTTTLHQC